MKLNEMKKKEQQAAVSEYKILRSLTHAYVISYKEAFIDASHLCIIMELAEGGDLDQRIKMQNSRLFSNDIVKKWIQQLSSAMQYVHGKKVIHRDIKAKNIFLDKTHNIKLGDFGIGE